MRYRYCTFILIVVGICAICAQLGAQSVIEYEPGMEHGGDKYFRVVVSKRSPKSNGYCLAVIGNTPSETVVSGKVVYGDISESYLSAALMVRDNGKNEDDEMRSWIMEVDLTRDIAEKTYLIVGLGSDGPGPSDRGRAYRIRAMDYIPEEEK